MPESSGADHKCHGRIQLQTGPPAAAAVLSGEVVLLGRLDVHEPPHAVCNSPGSGEPVRPLSRDEHGQAVVEFAIILIALLMMTVGLVDVGRGFYQYNEIGRA